MGYKINKKPNKKMPLGGQPDQLNTFGTMAGSIGAGAKAGSSFGPIGTVAGGIVGGIAGGVQVNNQVDEYYNNLNKQKQMDARQRSLSIQGMQGGYNNMPLMPMGGMAGAQTVELERGEPFMSPDGQINKISDQAPTHAQGGVPITLPSGTKVLGKKPATNEKTFKELGAKLEKRQAKYQKILDNKPSRIEETTAKRMLAKVDRDFNELFEIQGEDTQSNQMFPNGGVVRDPAIDYTLQNYRPESALTQQPGDFEAAAYGDMLRSTPLYDVDNPQQVNAYEMYFKGVPGPQNFSVGDPRLQGGRMESYTGPTGKTTFAGSEKPTFAVGGSVGNPDPRLLDNNIPIYTGEDPTYGGGFNMNNALGTAGALAPVAYNLIQGSQTPEQIATNAFQNPYQSEIRATMKNRRYNATPQLQAADLAEATYARRLREGAPTQSQYLGGLQAGTIGTQRAKGQILAQQNNVNNQYLAEQAQVDMSLGQADVGRQRYIEDANSRSRAAQRQHTAQAASQFGQFAQVKQQENGQMVRDMQRLNLLPSLVQNFTLDSNGQWIYKETGEVMSGDQVKQIVMGKNI